MYVQNSQKIHLNKFILPKIFRGPASVRVIGILLFGNQHCTPPYKWERSEPAQLRNSGDCEAGYPGEKVFCKVRFFLAQSKKPNLRRRLNHVPINQIV